jgi:RNA polymerase sigma-70 factor (ECF subfamily)
MKAFLYHVLNGLIIDEYRKKKATSLDVLLEKGFELSDTSSERTIDYFDGKKAILLIDSLPEAYQKVMQMRYVEDLSLEEMAVITGKTKNTMAVHAHRGMEKLRELYIEQQGQK